VIVVGAAHLPGGAPKSRIHEKGFIRGYDARTGKRLWIFHTIPLAGEFGNNTWERDSWSYTGNAGVWAQMTVDEETNTVFLPVELPTGDYYGGHRPGAGLYGESLVALDLKTGQRKWHFQLVHHGIWDMDIPCAPILMDLVVDGRPIKAIGQPTKQGWIYTFDRITGKPCGRSKSVRWRKGTGARRVVFADAAVRDEAAAVRAAGGRDRRSHRLHAGGCARKREGWSPDTRFARSFHAAGRKHLAGPARDR
jgi:glucose dehydrogenase